MTRNERALSESHLITDLYPHPDFNFESGLEGSRLLGQQLGFGEMESNPSVPAVPTRRFPRIKLDVGIGNSINPELLTPRQRIPVVVLEAIAIWNCIELFFMIFVTLRRKRGCYFWSLIVATGGIPILATANILNNLGLTNNRILVAFLILLGWMPMVVGQAFVLYSRLHLMFVTAFQLRLVLAMIITVAIVTSVPAWVLVIASNAPSPAARRFLLPYSIYEKIQVVLFFLEESCLSAIYIWKCYRFWNEQKLRARTKIRNMLIHLFFVHVLVLCLDISIIYFEWSGNYLIQTSYKAQSREPGSGEETARAPVPDPATDRAGVGANAGQQPGAGPPEAQGGTDDPARRSTAGGHGRVRALRRSGIATLQSRAGSREGPQPGFLFGYHASRTFVFKDKVEFEYVSHQGRRQGGEGQALSALRSAAHVLGNGFALALVEKGEFGHAELWRE
ncbi:hypothetical protein PG996_003470 [Apiospora saccharicola]|uniref:DUF7703 domain-containing protein n=1 Tax=Apiospora saccharicola TaxID=335842 RepID=A0ABR1W499_9PEZI